MLARSLGATALLSLLITTPAHALGVLAIDSNQGNQWGFAYGYSDIAQASIRAMEECGLGCQVVDFFANECAAYAADQSEGSTVYGWGKDSDASSAQSRALQECSNHGGSSCIVRVWGCDE
jgi:hypothetical protein